MLDWTRPAEELERRIRAFQPWPGAYTFWEGRLLKVLRAEALPDSPAGEPPGRVVPFGNGAAVATGQGLLRLVEVQLEGRNPLPVDAFLRGQKGFIGAVLG
ncbi:MAG: hypothetical protein D6793_01290 [Thermoflexia bacterium]|nr:MAG: hypothetical protein D6793_01290 [Thermoflexia bacterium]